MYIYIQSHISVFLCLYFSIHSNLLEFILYFTLCYRINSIFPISISVILFSNSEKPGSFYLQYIYLIIVRIHRKQFQNCQPMLLWKRRLCIDLCFLGFQIINMEQQFSTWDSFTRPPPTLKGCLAKYGNIFGAYNSEGVLLASIGQKPEKLLTTPQQRPQNKELFLLKCQKC